MGDSQSRGASGRKILLVEDEPTLQRILGSVLTDAGHTVEAVGTAEAAVDQLDATEIDLVLSDKNLPGMSGLSLLDKVRDLEQVRDRLFAFVLVTGYPSRDSALDVLRSGGDGYLVKPFRSLVDAVGQIERALDAPLLERRRGSRLAGRAVDYLAGDGDKVRADTALLNVSGAISGILRQRLIASDISVVDSLGALKGERSLAICDDIAELESVAQAKPDCGLVLVDAGAGFGDLLSLIAAGGARVLDPKPLAPVSS